MSDRKIIKEDFEECYTYDDNGNLFRRHIKRYDKEGYCIECKCFVYERYSVKESDVRQNTYDKNGNAIYQTQYIENFYKEPTKKLSLRNLKKIYNEKGKNKPKRTLSKSD